MAIDTIEQTVSTYMTQVTSGAIPAGHWLRQAVERQRSDLANGGDRGLYFDRDAAELVVNFFALLKHSKGEWAGQSFRLEPWQMFILWVLFGWKRIPDETRRFRTSYLEVGRKNGKSTLAAGVGLDLLVADGEPGAEVYTASTKRDQSRITHSEATRMVKASPSLRKRLRVFHDNINIPDTASKFEPLGADEDTMDGLNIHGAVVDELHAHKTRGVVDKLTTATSARRQPLIFEITTAGYDRQSICYEHHDYTEKVLDGTVQDDTWFGVIYSIDPGDSWEDERAWYKANPNLGISKKLDYMRTQAAKAKQMPSELNAFLRLDLDVWTEAETRWLPVEHWSACGMAVDAQGLRGRRCYGGLDLSSTTDISALILVFPPQDEEDCAQVLCRFWIPEEAMHIRSERDRVPYDAWVRQGYITATPGNVIDYSYILNQIDEDAQAYDLSEMAFDRWGATMIIQAIQDLGLTCVQFGQGFASMSAPMKELEKLILSHKIAHGNNPVLTWMAGNLVASVDSAGNIKPDKAKSIEKIDGMVALIMALDRALRHENNDESIYNEHGLRLL